MWPKSNEINDYGKYTNPDYILKQDLEKDNMIENLDKNGNKTAFKFTM